MLNWEIKWKYFLNKIKEYQPLVDVATDKLFTTIPSEFSGIIHKILNKEEEIC